MKQVRPIVVKQYVPRPSRDGDIHCMPIVKDGKLAHEMSESCWCEPRVEEWSQETGKICWLHHKPH